MFLLTMLLLLLILPTSIAGWSKIAQPSINVLPAHSIRNTNPQVEEKVDEKLYRNSEQYETLENATEKDASEETTPSVLNDYLAD